MTLKAQKLDSVCIANPISPDFFGAKLKIFHNVPMVVLTRLMYISSRLTIGTYLSLTSISQLLKYKILTIRKKNHGVEI